MFAGVLSDWLIRVFWLTKSSVFVGVVERGCFLEEEDSAALLELLDDGGLTGLEEF